MTSRKSTKGSSTNVDDVATGFSNMNHPETAISSEMVGQMEKASKPNSTGQVEAIPRQVIQLQSESHSKVAVVSLPSQQVTTSRTESYRTGTVPKLQKAQNSANNKNKANDVVVTRNLRPRVRENRVSSCKLCENFDNDNMVQCDLCDSWYHFSCVDVSESIAEVSWSCPGCAKVISANVTNVQTPSAMIHLTSEPVNRRLTNVQILDNPPPNAVVSLRSSGTTSKSSASRRKTELLLKRLEEERVIQMQYLERKYKLLQDLESEKSSVASDLESFADNMSKVQQWMEDTGIHGNDSGLVDLYPEEDPETSHQQESHNHPGLRAEPPKGLIGGEGQGRNYSQRPVHNCVNLQNYLKHRNAGNPRQNVEPRVTFTGTGRCVSTRPGVSNQFTEPDPYNQYLYNRTESHRYSTNPRETGTFTGGLDFIPRQGSTPVRQTLSRVTEPAVSNEDGEMVYSLNRSQLAARQAVSKDLPDFGGNPEDWPLFYSIFNSSTQLCGFTNEENMLRLRKCLKGKALEAVKCRLLHPSNVHGVMQTLKMLYGRPEAIIQGIVRKIRALPPPSIEKLDTVIHFALNVENLVATVEACEIKDFMYNASLKYELMERLPPTLKLDWAKHSRNNPTPNLLEFSSWLRSIAEDASSVSIFIGSENRSRVGKKDSYLNVHSREDTSPSNKPLNSQDNSRCPGSKELMKVCVCCKGSCSNLGQCKRFNELSSDSRWAVTREFKVCRKCLRKHYGPCKQNKACGVNGCSFLHHSLLHSDRKSSTDEISTDTAQSGRSQRANTSCNVHQGQSEVLLRIIPVFLHGPSKTLRAYAFLDDGSELTLMEQSLADELGVKGPAKTLCLRWTGGTTRTEDVSQKVTCQISSIANPSKKFPLSNVHTVGNLQLRPQTLIVPEMKQKYRYLADLPIESYQEISPRILIGLDHASLSNIRKCREGTPNEPIAVKTRLGWTVYGCCKTKATYGYVNHHTAQLCQCRGKADEDLNEIMKQYFSLEGLGVSTPNKLLLSNEDQRAGELLETLTRRMNGRYESGLLWKYESVRLPDSKTMALRRWECLNRRLLKDRDLAQVINSTISDYLVKGYIRKLTVEELTTPQSHIWYLPMFPVVNPNKPGKTRLVWDAAAKSYGVSLNSVLLKGPDLLTSLISVLIRFREFRMAVSGDIREMYHQILMRPADQHRQRFFWKEKETDTNPSTYIMQVLSFGACCSPSIAQYVKNMHAKRYEHDYPDAVDAIIHQHYVDDMLISAESEEKAIQLATDVKMIHRSGGFEMRNWVSNSSRIVTALNGEKTEEKTMNIGQIGTTEKVLGMWWDTSADCFTYKLSTRHDPDLLAGRKCPTKREVLRTLMMIFDPLGLISQFTMFLRSLLQEIWRASVDWDEQIHAQQFEKWLKWLHALPRVADLKIPRCYRIATTANESNIVEMHTFVDASENGFAAVIYLRFEEGNTVECALAGAKTRVSPLKFLSIPRSELQAAVIGVRLADTIQRSLSKNILKRFFWTDSRDVLCWIQSDHRRYSQYVGARISEILETTNIQDWCWISTKLNVADEGTKWKTIPDLSSTSRWFRGPDFLWKCKEEWPAKLSSVGVTDTELRPHLQIHLKVQEPVIDVDRFSQWSTLLRTTAYVMRAVRNFQCTTRRIPITGGPLTRDELVEAEAYLYRTAQRSTYNREVSITSVSQQEQSPSKISKTSPLYGLYLFLDENGVLRNRGRANGCKFIDRSVANPVVLPRKHSVTKLIVMDVHRKLLHRNHATIINELKQRYYIPRLKVVYKSVRNECQLCKNELARPHAPMMSDLPPARLAAYSRPFCHMGVDYFGPMIVRIGRRTEKRWGVLVTCLTVRAIHLEVAHSLTADSCIMALRNVIARRGIPITIYSDRGTNFVGANKELKMALEELNHDKIVAELTTSHTTWSFIPPLSPHMGGAWERLIQTVKQNLNKLLPSHLPNDETLRNMLIEVEYIVNSRPLTDIPLDDDQSPVLTPNHFITGTSNGLPPWTCFNDNPLALKQSWRLSQAMANQFWKQWIHDYLPTITRRTKWFTKVKPIEINDIVIIVDMRLPCNS
ncbi:uncharacterized protein LOC131425801 [Malaya genurostris]|uniref:uncharacterized protein LOC131425801 n=1 Tax=Malaya genurostris TaxID=325434 RepID=UPI0026F3FB12|nr:uncharacterized protein LOC131425801 [Malaya genurostris]